MRRTPLRKINPDYAVQLRIYYSRTKPEWLEEHPGCQFEVAPGVQCGITYGVDVHHKNRRRKFLNDKRYLMTVCRKHHDWIEANKNKARLLGYILYI